MAMGVTTCEPRMELALLHACESAVVCDSMDVARELCFHRNQQVKAVTLDGGIIYK